MKKFLLILILAFIFLHGCNTTKPVVDEVEIEEEEEKEEEFLGDDKMDRYRREYVNGAIVIPSDELTNLVADFWSKITLGDMSFIDLLYLPEEKLNSLKEITNTEEGRKAIVKMLDKSTITADGVNEAVFLKINIDSDGTCLVNENQSNIEYKGVSHKYFYEVLSLEHKEPLGLASDLIKYIEKFNTEHKALDQNNTTINFVYVDGKPKIDGRLFFGSFGLFKKLGPNQKYITDLVKDAYYEDAKSLGDMKDINQYIQDGEYVWIYELLRKQGVLDELTVSPKDSIRKLYSLTPDQRSNFMAEMRRLPKPISRPVRKNGRDMIVTVYYYKDMYGSMPTGNIVDSIYEMGQLKEFDGIVIDDIIKNLLLVQEINVDEMD